MSQVHSGYPVVVGPVSAVAADIQVAFLVTVGFADFPAFRAGLACVGRVNEHDFLTVAFRLVFDHLPELVETPTDLNIPVLDPDLFGRIADSRKVFENEHRIPVVMVDECLRRLMVHISHPTVFSVAYGLESSAGASGAAFLQLLTEPLVFAALAFHLPSMLEDGGFAVITGGEHSDSQVHAHYVFGAWGWVGNL